MQLRISGDQIPTSVACTDGGVIILVLDTDGSKKVCHCCLNRCLCRPGRADHREARAPNFMQTTPTWNHTPSVSQECVLLLCSHRVLFVQDVRDGDHQPGQRGIRRLSKGLVAVPLFHLLVGKNQT